MRDRRAKQRRECGGKLRHTNRENAEKHVQAHFRIFGEWLQSYPCRFCRAWHIGHPTRRYSKPPERPVKQFGPYEQWVKTLSSARQTVQQQADVAPNVTSFSISEGVG